MRRSGQAERTIVRDALRVLGSVQGAGGCSERAQRRRAADAVLLGRRGSQRAEPGLPEPNRDTRAGMSKIARYRPRFMLTAVPAVSADSGDSTAQWSHRRNRKSDARFQEASVQTRWLAAGLDVRTAQLIALRAQQHEILLRQGRAEPNVRFRVEKVVLTRETIG